MYGLLLIIPEQKTLVEKHCFGDCGKAILGAVIDKQYGEIAVCHQLPADCPYIDKQMLEPIGTVSSGEKIILRKLRD